MVILRRTNEMLTRKKEIQTSSYEVISRTDEELTRTNEILSHIYKQFKILNCIHVIIKRTNEIRGSVNK